MFSLEAVSRRIKQDWTFRKLVPFLVYGRFTLHHTPRMWYVACSVAWCATRRACCVFTPSYIFQSRVYVFMSPVSLRHHVCLPSQCSFVLSRLSCCEFIIQFTLAVWPLRSCTLYLPRKSEQQKERTIGPTTAEPNFKEKFIWTVMKIKKTGTTATTK